jgi:glycosyltransferase involved in cell wall biosynthesis
MQLDSASARVRRRIDFWRDAPHGITLAVDPGYAHTLQRILETTTFDAVLIDHLYMMQYARFVRPCPVFFSATDVETTKFMRWYADEPRAFKQRVFHWMQQKVIRFHESRLDKQASVVFATSEVDRGALEQMNRGGRFSVVANGVDLAYFQPRPPDSFNQPPAILFVGSMFYKPNFQAATFLANEVFPAIRAQIPEVSCHLAGKTQKQNYSGLHQPQSGVYMHGFVPDIRPYLEKCQIMVVPLFVGSGTRIKIIEAMATATPVVATSVGAEGLNYSDGENIVIANSKDELASAVIRLLRDREMCSRIGAAGRRLVEKEYTWEASAAVLRNEIAYVLARP